MRFWRTMAGFECRSGAVPTRPFWASRLAAAASLLLLAPFSVLPAAPAWKPAQAPLMTRWATQVTPTNAHPEYPRPQLVRPDWLNLNGLWDYAIRSPAEAEPGDYDGSILVPFPVESALSGVMRPLSKTNVLWYRRTAFIPESWRGKRVRLQFGAVDWECQVSVNGRPVGRHQGGYERFGFDITDRLLWNGPEEVLVRVLDPTEGDQPRGKQSLKPEGIFYSASSGIWQTVWLEPVPQICIDDLRLVPDLDAKGLRLRVAVNSLADDLTVEAHAFEGQDPVGRTNGPAAGELLLPIPEPRRWSPDTPFLYDLQVVLRKGGREIDRVESYFGMRKVGLVRDDQGFTRIALNDKILFQIGTLDQGFWPDGHYTAPTDEALRSDIFFLKSAGFNLARKHVKIEPDRWYYWCDRLGLLVWQDMPSGNNATPEGQREFEAELLHMLKDLGNHPSIILWVLFNEGWGQYDTQALAQRLKTLDPSRLVDNASGWTDLHVGDVVDVHNYPGPSVPESEPRRASVLGEFGGIGLALEGRCWSPTRRWGYGMEADLRALTNSYAQLLHLVWNLHDLHGLSAAVYTQTTDVETECNGLLTYDRQVAKVDPAVLACANKTGGRSLRSRVVAANALVGMALWRYTLDDPGAGWFAPGFDASSWKEGMAGFGTPRTPGALIQTTWNTPDIWLRRQFELRAEDLPGLRLHVHHDEDTEIYINGILASSLRGYTTFYDEFDIAPEAAATLKPGANVLAVHCHQTAGGQYIDVGLIAPRAQPPRSSP